MGKRFRELSQDELDVLADAVRLGRLPYASEDEVAAAAKARQELMEAYAPLAARISEKYAGKLGRQEALSASYLGLALALRSWDPDKGALPSWIRTYCKGSLLREVDTRHMIRLPQVIAPKRAQLLHLRDQGVSDAEIAQRLKIDIAELDELAAHPTVSVWMDAHDREYPGSEEAATPESTTEVQALLQHLTEIERIVISARFGIGFDGLCHSHDEVADMTGLTVQDSRVVEARVLMKLRSLKDLSAQT